MITLEQVQIEVNRKAIPNKQPMPECHCDIQTYLGFTDFYKWFIKGFSIIVRPMTSMLKGGKEGKIFSLFEPTPEVKEAL